MAHIVADRVKETSTTVGTGDFLLSGIAINSFQKFANSMSVGDTCYYCIQSDTQWEVGYGTFATGNILQRTTVTASSNSNTLVDFIDGPKEVFGTIPAYLINLFINHLSNSSNPHNVTKSQVGLSNVDNTSDLNKPISTATQIALNLKANDNSVIHLTGDETSSGIKTFGTIDTTNLTVSGGTFEWNRQTADVFSNGLRINKRGTTGDANAALTDFTEVGYHQFYGWTGTAYKRLAYIIARANGAINDSTGGGTYRINTRNSTSNAESDKIIIGDTTLLQTDVTLVTGTSATYAFRVQTGTGAIGMGNDATANYIQSFGSRPLVFNLAGNYSTFYGSVRIENKIAAPTHSVTLGSTSTGIAAYNTSDETTNLERYMEYWSGNVLNMLVDAAGTGVLRSIKIGNSTNNLVITDGALLTTSTATIPLNISSNPSTNWADHYLRNTRASSTSNQVNLIFLAKQSNGADQRIFQLSTSWNNATVGTRKSYVGFSVFDTDAQVTAMEFWGKQMWIYGNVKAADTTNGMKIGTATTEKLSFWNKTPIVQPTTAITGAAFVAGAGTAVNDASTFGGYTLAKIAAALINVGILA